MPAKVHPTALVVTPKELREIQKYHELGMKYWPPLDTRRYEEEEKRTDPERWKYYFRHPYSRLTLAYMVVFCNFLMFSIDPVSQSNSPCVINYVGEIYTFVFVRWPRGSFVLVKLGCIGFAILLACLVGKFLIHKWLFCRKLRLKIFSEDGQGSWMVMFMTSVMSLYIFHFAYNGFLMLEGKYMDKLHASHNLDMKNKTFMKAAAIVTWLGDFLTAWMVTDMMLQGLKYTNWAKGLRTVWSKGYNRLYAFWFIAVSMTTVVITGITTDFVKWKKLNYEFVASDEISRAFLSSFILVIDLLVIMQDWEFPYFAGGIDVKLPGVNSNAFTFNLPGECGEVYIAGKWFNYGIVFIIMILDLNMWKNQIFYEPYMYGQYTDCSGHIYVVSDMQFIRYANRSMMTYEWRWSHINPKTNRTYGPEDDYMVSKYKGYSLGLKSIAFVPSIFPFCLFAYFVWLFGQGENPDEELVRKYRSDVRRERQLKKQTKKHRRAKKEKLKFEQEKQLNGNLHPSEGKLQNSTVIFEPFQLGDRTKEESCKATNDVCKNPSGLKPLKRDLKYWLRHPYLRILTAYLVVFCNFLIFAEDPVSHSHTECVIDIIGNIYVFMFSRYPPNKGFVALKVLMFTTAIVFGCLVGKFFVHKFLLCRALKVKLFSESGQGSWMVMFLTSLMSLYFFGHFYSEFLALAGPSYNAYLITRNMGIQNETFMKIAAMGTWLGDFITAWMVTDMMLQENQYPWWNKSLRAWWRRGANRVIAFWSLAVTMSIIVATAISTNYLDWDRISRDFMPTNELSRAFLASFILVMDLMIVMQDWEFPHFSGGMNIKLPGLNTGNINFHFPGGDIHITGKWFNYGIIFIVMILDLNMWKNQIFYHPSHYGQYVDSSGYIFTVTDRVWLTNATEETLSYAWRWNHTNPLTNHTYGADDHKMNSRFYGYSLDVKGVAFIPSLFMFVFFAYLVKRFSKDEKAGNFTHENAKNEIVPSQSPTEDAGSLEKIKKNSQLETRQHHEDLFTLSSDIQRDESQHLNSINKDIRHSTESFSCSLVEKSGISESGNKTASNNRKNFDSPLVLKLPELVNNVNDLRTSPTNQISKNEENKVMGRTAEVALEDDSPEEKHNGLISVSNDEAPLPLGELLRRDCVSSADGNSPLDSNSFQPSNKEALNHWRTVKSKLLSTESRSPSSN